MDISEGNRSSDEYEQRFANSLPTSPLTSQFGKMVEMLRMPETPGPPLSADYGSMHPESPNETTTTSESKKKPKGQLSQTNKQNILETIKTVLKRCFQPPAIGAITGIIVAVSPLRGILVDISDRNSSAPLEWLFDGFFAVGQAAVPINMMILGCNLSASYSSKMVDPGMSKTGSPLLPMNTTVGIVLGKMVVMPMIAFLLTTLMRSILTISDDIQGAFYLVVMIVFLCPTANNVMVMVELSGSGAKQGIARVIALQYAVAPIILSCTMTIAIGMASNWS